MGQILFVELIRPLWGNKRAGAVLLARLNHAGHAHGAAVALDRRDGFAKFGPRLAANAVFRAAQRREYAIARAIGKVAGAYHMVFLRGHLPAGNGGDLAAIHLAGVHRAVQDQIDIGLAAHDFIQDPIPDGIVLVRIAIAVFHHDFFQDTGFQHVPLPCAAHPHADFAGCVSAEHGPFLHKGNLCAMPGGFDRRAHARQAAAYNGKIRVVVDGAQPSFHGNIPFRRNSATSTTDGGIPIHFYSDCLLNPPWPAMRRWLLPQIPNSGTWC